MTNTVRKILPKADLYLLSVTLIWGSTFTVTKFVLEDYSPLMLQGTRFVLASIFVGILTWKDIKKTSAKTLRHGLILGVLLGLGFAFQTMGLETTSASNGGFLTGTLVVMVPVLQVLIERKLPNIGNIIGILLVAVGIYFLSTPSGASLGTGDILVLICAFAFALYIVMLDVYTKAAFHQEIVFYQFIVTAAIGLAFSPFVEESRLTLAADSFGGILYLAVFASTVALFVQSKYQRETTPTKAAIIFTMEPVFAAIIAFFWRDEVLAPIGYVGAGIMVLGLFVSELYPLVQERFARR
ncbi:MAG: hypothetical protein CL946_07085 [Ectothiorhodospiraceae bacterium]|nr:hypothetical protein [Ectothiorhodospiraceae bacterium]